MRLIDADELLKNANKDGAYGYVSTKEIEEAPTAFDAEAVVRELDSKIELSREPSKDEDNAEGMFAISELFYRKGLKEAIDIVKRGGRNE